MKVPLRALTSGPLIAAAGGIVVMLIVGLSAGQDFNYDLMNYHVASAHLLMTGALDRNVAPSGVQSWFNPIGYVPLYLGITTLPPRLLATLLAIAAGLNAPLIYLLAERTTAGLPRAERVRLSLCATLIGMTGAITLSEAATSFLDNILSLAELGALLCAMRSLEDRPQLRLGCTGLLLGLATGLKLTVGVFAIGMTLALLLTLIRRRIQPSAFGIFALAGVVGFLITGGWWAWHLWASYRNPVFPMANDLFRSSWAPAVPFNDTTFQPKNWTGAFTYPLHWAFGDRTPGAEIAIRDPRYALGLLAVLLCIPGAVRLAARGSDRRGDETLLLGSFFTLSYLVWLFVFGILRYAVVLEMLSGVLVLSLVRTVPVLSAEARLRCMIIVTLFTVALTRTASWGRVPFSSDWFGVTNIGAVHRPGTVYVMPDDAPLGFMVALFPADARFVHIGGNMPLDPATGLGRRAAEMIGQASIRRTLAASPDSPKGVAALRHFGLVQVPGSCQSITTKIAMVETCQLTSSR